jgi:hypothetical protein
VILRRVRLDVDWAAEGPRIDAVAEAIDGVEGVEGLNVTVTEVDMETIGSDVIVEGTGIDLARLFEAIEATGAVVHSIDQVAAGDRIVGFEPRAR